jgi:hypothetical protein
MVSISSTLNACVFCTNVVSAAFFTFVHMQKKAAEMTFIQKRERLTLMKLTHGNTTFSGVLVLIIESKLHDDMNIKY